MCSKIKIRSDVESCKILKILKGTKQGKIDSDFKCFNHPAVVPLHDVVDRSDELPEPPAEILPRASAHGDSIKC